VIDLTPEQFSISVDVGILTILIAGAFILIKSNKKLENLNQRLRILVGIKEGDE